MIGKPVIGAHTELRRERDDNFRMPPHAKSALSIQSNSMRSIASNCLLDCLTILLELLGED